MNGDHPATSIHRSLFGGRSDLANAPENSSPDFQTGYTAGLSFTGTLCDRTRLAWLWYGSPREHDPRWAAYREWKRGFYAAAMQALFAAKKAAG